jgi:hypothetical protein
MKPTKANKAFDLKVAAGATITPEILAKINKYALRVLNADEIFVRKYLMAHNAVDRDNERFSEELLSDFAKTFPGKSFMISHDRSTLGKGLFFDALTEEMTPEQFTALTGEEARLPDRKSTVKVVWAWVYMLKAQFNEEIIANIDAGIYRHASIGFRANDIAPVKGQYDQTLYYEYQAPGEALEGSLVWLGAQPGATAQKIVTSSAEPKSWKEENPLVPGGDNHGEKGDIFERGLSWPKINPLIPAETRAWMEKKKAEASNGSWRVKNPLLVEDKDEQSTNMVFYRFHL